MNFLHNRDVLQKRKEVAIKSHQSLFYTRISYVLLGLFISGVVGAFVFVFLSDNVDVNEKAIFEKVISETKKKGVVIKNVSYKSVKSNIAVSAVKAQQLDVGIKLQQIFVRVGKDGTLVADSADVNVKEQKMTAKGNVKYTQKGGLTLHSDKIVYDEVAQTLHNKGRTLATNKEIVVQGNDAQYDLNTNILTVKDGVKIEIKE